MCLQQQQQVYMSSQISIQEASQKYKIIQSILQCIDPAGINQLKRCGSHTAMRWQSFFSLRVRPIQIVEDLQIGRTLIITFWKDSFEESGKYMLGPYFDFIRSMKKFDCHAVNQQTIELLQPLFVDGQKWFHSYTIRKHSKTLEKICEWLFEVYDFCLQKYSYNQQISQ